MHITVEPHDSYAVLHLRGEFDTYYCPMLQQEIDALGQAGVDRVVLNLRLVKFINSTALGAIIKASKSLNARGGKLVIARPSAFCRDILEKVGLDRVVPVYETDEAAADALESGAPHDAAHGEGARGEDQASVLFSPVDAKRLEHFLPADARRGAGGKAAGSWNGVGRMSGLDAKGLRFTWSGGNTDLTPFAMAQMLALGTQWRVKFRLPLLRRGYCEAIATVSEVEERPDGVKIGATFAEIDDETRQAVKQYAKDMAFLKDELKRATDR
jgi:anti-anti-sigma factor